MEEEVKRGIHKFEEECQRQLPGISLVIPVRPTQAAFLVSFTYKGVRTYDTIHEDDFATWGEQSETPDTLTQKAQQTIAKLLREPSQS